MTFYRQVNILDTQALITCFRCKSSCTERSSSLRSRLLLFYKPLAYKEKNVHFLDSILQIDISVRDTHMIAGLHGLL